MIAADNRTPFDNNKTKKQAVFQQDNPHVFFIQSQAIRKVRKWNQQRKNNRKPVSGKYAEKNQDSRIPWMHLLAQPWGSKLCLPGPYVVLL